MAHGAKRPAERGVRVLLRKGQGERVSLKHSVIGLGSLNASRCRRAENLEGRRGLHSWPGQPLVLAGP
jgi:hypothetical protein